MHLDWLVPARFACLRCMNDTGSVSREVGPADRRPKEARSENFMFVDLRTAMSDHSNFNPASVRATCSLSPEDEQFVDNRHNYEFK